MFRGDCYIHGIMHGEALQKDHEIEELVLRWDGWTYRLAEIEEVYIYTQVVQNGAVFEILSSEMVIWDSRVSFWIIDGNSSISFHLAYKEARYMSRKILVQMAKNG